ncbi:MAG: hypothetical protein ACKO38_09130 [Planctomycetota bacterium]
MFHRAHHDTAGQLLRIRVKRSLGAATIAGVFAFAWAAPIPNLAYGQFPAPTNYSAFPTNSPLPSTPAYTPDDRNSSTATDLPPYVKSPVSMSAPTPTYAPTPTNAFDGMWNGGPGTVVPVAGETAPLSSWTDPAAIANEPMPTAQPATHIQPGLAPAMALFGEPLREPESVTESLIQRLPGRRMWHDKAEAAEEELHPNYFEFPLYSYRGAGHDPGDQWIIGNGNGLGIFTLDVDTGRSAPDGDPFFSWHPDVAIHWVSGPRSTDMPARLYDLLLRFQHSFAVNDVWRYDISATIGYYTDFEGSARRGLRWPATAVLYCRPLPVIDLFAGVDILDRDDLFCLPVAGVTWKPEPHWRFDFAFPKPRAAMRFDNGSWIYVAGDIGGGSWAIERQSGEDDIATYRDYRIRIGSISPQSSGIKSNASIGVAFDRHLQYRLQPGTFDAGATFFWQFSSDF